MSTEGTALANADLDEMIANTPNENGFSWNGPNAQAAERQEKLSQELMQKAEKELKNANLEKIDISPEMLNIVREQIGNPELTAQDIKGTTPKEFTQYIESTLKETKDSTLKADGSNNPTVDPNKPLPDSIRNHLTDMSNQAEEAFHQGGISAVVDLGKNSNMPPNINEILKNANFSRDTDITMPEADASFTTVPNMIDKSGSRGID